jgi:FkbM family methyltransferase
MFNIHELLAGDPPTIRIVDIGAMSLGEGRDPYEALTQNGPTRIVGFEPVAAECEKLKALHGERRTYLPYAVGDGQRRVFHTCNFPMTSSLYEPNTALLDKFQNLENLVRVVERSEIETRRLDDIPEVAETDYLKVDVQGAEADVLAHATHVLKNTLVVHTEVEFVPIYREQPLFADVDAILRRHGFLFHRFASISGRMFKPLLNKTNVNAMGSQWLWADAVYVRDFMQLAALTAEQLLKLAIILHTLYQSFDLCAFVLRHYQDQTGEPLADRYLARFGGK